MMTDLSERRQGEVYGQPGVTWYSSKFLLDLQMSIQKQGVKNVPVYGFVEIHEQELDQREAFIWKTIKANGEPATKPEEAERFLMARPAIKSGTDEAWQEKLAEARAAMDEAVERMVAIHKNEEPECDRQLDGWTWTDSDGKVRTQDGEQA
jgi:hypothetical protein